MVTSRIVQLSVQVSYWCHDSRARGSRFPVSILHRSITKCDTCTKNKGTVHSCIQHVLCTDQVSRGGEGDRLYESFFLVFIMRHRTFPSYNVQDSGEMKSTDTNRYPSSIRDSDAVAADDAMRLFDGTTARHILVVQYYLRR